MRRALSALVNEELAYFTELGRKQSETIDVPTHAALTRVQSAARYCNRAKRIGAGSTQIHPDADP